MILAPIIGMGIIATAFFGAIRWNIRRLVGLSPDATVDHRLSTGGTLVELGTTAGLSHGNFTAGGIATAAQVHLVTGALGGRISERLRLFQRFNDYSSGIPWDPLVLDLNRDGQINLQNATFFDFDANGFHELAAWIDKGDAFLVLDKNFNGIIDNGSEMFGDAMILPDGSRALSGFHALSAFDSNGDGRIDINDDIFSSLKLLTGAGYLVSLADAGIKSITLPPTASVRGSKIFSLSFYGASRWISSDIADRHRKSA